MTRIALAAHQLRYDQKIFWRNHPSVFFTVLFPAMLMAGLAALTHGDTIHVGGGIAATSYFLAAVLAFAVVSATMVNLAMNLTIARESGVLKRLRGTPLPASALIAGRIGNATILSLLMLAVVTAMGAAFGADIPWDHAIAILVTVVVGAASFCALGIALTAIIPSREAATPITNVVVFPLYFLSGIFVPVSEIPNGALTFADVFPIRHLFQALLTGFDPNAAGAGFELGHLGVVAAWGLAGTLIAARTLRWTPRSG